MMGLALTGCATAPPCPEPEPAWASGTSPSPATPTPAPAAATVVIFVRHAEKASDGTSDPPLTARGQRRAECLAALLDPFEPDTLLSSEYRRTQATLAPLARATGATVETIEAGNAEAWATALQQLPAGARVVVSGHSNTLPAWVAALGTRLESLDPEGNIPHDDYDRMIHVIVGEGRAAVSFETAYCVEPEP
ncbi:MAG: phosphoglycerate mutase family protein [Nannocystaceae bacterium]